MIELLTFGLATWRIAAMLVYEDGPKYILKAFRERVGIEYDIKGEIETVKENLLAGVLSCLWCCSVWVGAFFVLLHLFYPLMAMKIATAFALSAVAIVVDHFITKR